MTSLKWKRTSVQVWMSVRADGSKVLSEFDVLQRKADKSRSFYQGKISCLTGGAWIDVVFPGKFNFGPFGNDLPAARISPEQAISTSSLLISSCSLLPPEKEGDVR